MPSAAVDTGKSTGSSASKTSPPKRTFVPSNPVIVTAPDSVTSTITPLALLSPVMVTALLANVTRTVPASRARGSSCWTSATRPCQNLRR